MLTTQAQALAQSPESREIEIILGRKLGFASSNELIEVAVSPKCIGSRDYPHAARTENR